MSRRSIIYLSLRQIIDLHATDKSQYKSQARTVQFFPPAEILIGQIKFQARLLYAREGIWKKVKVLKEIDEHYCLQN